MGILSNEQREPNQEKPANRGGGTLSQALIRSRSSLRCVREELAQTDGSRRPTIPSAAEDRADHARTSRTCRD